MQDSIGLLLSALALCITGIDLGLSTVYKRLFRGPRTTALIVFCATSLGLVFFLLVSSWSSLTFYPSLAGRVLNYVWTGIVIADLAFLISFLPYFISWLIARPWRRPLKSFFFILSLLFIAASVTDEIVENIFINALPYIIYFILILICLCIMLRGRKNIEDRQVRAMLLTLGIIGLALLPLLISSFVFDFIRAIVYQIFFLLYSIAMLAFLSLSIAREINKLKEEGGKAKAEDEPVDLALYHITEREGEVIELIGKGLTNKEIAATLGLSVNTVNNHIANIFSKTGVRSRIDLLNLLRRGKW